MNISTIITLFNGQTWIRAALENILAQSEPSAEVIVVDDGSTDGSLEIVRSFGGVRLLQNPGKGANPSRRHGIEQAQHNFVTLVDQDDFWHREHLAQMMVALEAVPEPPGAVAGVHLFERGTEPEYAPWGGSGAALDPWASFPINPIETRAQVVFRRDLLLDHGGWERRFPGVADFHAWLTLTARRPFAQAARTVAHRVHPASRLNLLKRRNRWDFCDRYLSAAQDRVSLRLRYHPSEASRVRSRLLLARHVFAWRFADAMLGPRQAAPLALQADRLLAAESAETQHMILDQALSFFPLDDRPNRLRKAVGLIRLWRRCPREAVHLRSALRRQLKRRVSAGAPAGA